MTADSPAGSPASDAGVSTVETRGAEMFASVCRFASEEAYSDELYVVDEARQYVANLIESRRSLSEENARLTALVDRISRAWARDSFDETIIAPLDAIEPFRAEVGLPRFTNDEIAEFDP